MDIGLDGWSCCGIWGALFVSHFREPARLAQVKQCRLWHIINSFMHVHVDGNH